MSNDKTIYTDAGGKEIEMEEKLIPVRVTFYKTPWQLKLKYLVNQLISIRTWSKYSHCEILDLLTSTSYTSTMRGKANGTVRRDAGGVYDKPGHWDYVEVMLTEQQYAPLKTWMDHQVRHNKGYSKWDILKFVSPIHFPDSKRFICSEFVNNGLCAIALIKKWGIVSPQAVLNKLCKLGLTVEPMKGAK